MRLRLFIVNVVAVGMVRAPLGAQVQVSDSVRAAIHRIFGTRDFSSQSFGPAAFIEGGRAYTTVEPSPGVRGAADIVRYETATGARSILVPATALVPAGQTTPLDFDAYSWSADQRKLLLFTNTQRVWRQNTRGDYWVLTLATRKLQKLGGKAPSSSLMYAKFSPDGERVAYVSRGDLYVERLADGAVTRLTRGATATLVNGMTDWVYEEEFDLRDGFRWSPDGTKIAYWQFDMSGVGTFDLVDYTDSLYPIITPIQYPKAGTTNSAVRIGVIPAGGGATTWLVIPGDPRNNYLPWMEWAGPGELLVQHMNRLQNTNTVILANAATGTPRTVLVDRDSAWVDVVDDVPWVDNGKRFLFTSERDGWRHVYAISRDGREIKLVTNGPFDVVSVVGVDAPAGWLYYIASPDNATQRYLFRTRLDGTGAPARLSPANAPGTHRYTLSPDAQWAFHTYSAFDVPPVTDLVRIPSHDRARMLADNAELARAVKPVLNPPVEYFKVPVSGGVSVDGWMIKPQNFDSTKTYPILVYVYGEPASQTTTDQWMGSSGLWYRTLANQGYIVASFDNSGTPAPRGRDWRKVVYRAVGVLSSRQQADAVKVLSRTRHYVDSTRVAIWGWSGGGSSTLQGMFRYPDVYQVGMSVAPVPDQRLYDTIYQERYMGLPQQNADDYRAASPISHAEGLRGSLLLVHGSGDDNVHFQGSQELINRLVQLGKQFDFMEYPNRSHCICEGAGTTEHVYQTLTRYLLTHLPAGGR
ncbi:MAG TPA: S9 family peptidase [Gemmatimonadaceae bacterium]|nr:S9 family peptidase [Gemmatimonadaceae bacterium]